MRCVLQANYGECDGLSQQLKRKAVIGPALAINDQFTDGGDSYASPPMLSTAITRGMFMKYTHAFWTTAITLMFLFLGLPEVMAQTAQSFEQLQLLVKPGDKVSVTDPMGVVTEGKIEGLSSALLRLRVNSAIQDLSESDVKMIRQRRNDSLKNGTLIGAGVGLGIGVVYLVACATYECTTGEAVGGALIYTGFGAAIGVGIDALIKSKETIYLGRTKVTLNLHSIKPILSPNRKGVAMSFSF
jgi:hypothetical protein